MATRKTIPNTMKKPSARRSLVVTLIVMRPDDHHGGRIAGAIEWESRQVDV